MRVTYRQIARVLVKGLPLDDDEVAGKVDEYTKAIEAMPEEARVALKAGYIFSSKVPLDERRDMFQELFYAVLRKDTKDEGVAYMTARGKWLDELGCGEHKKKRQPVSSLNRVTVLDNQEVELIDTLVGMDDLEDKVIERIEAQRIYRELPRHIKLIVKKRFRGEKLQPSEKRLLFNCREELRSSNPDYRYRAASHTRGK
jgi:hypothetical protein